MNKKEYYFLQFILKVGISLFFLSVPLWAELSNSESGIVLSILFSSLFAFLSYIDFKKSKLTNNVDMPYSPQANSSVDEQIYFYRKYIYIGSFAFLFLTIIVITDLNNLETGQPESVNTFAPAAFIYEQLGYWPAVLTVPILGIICTLLFLKKVRDSKRQK